MTVFCSLTSFAKPPRRAQVYGAIYGGDGTVATRNLKISPINNNVFGLYDDETTYELCTNLYLYFLTNTETISNFRIRLRLLSTEFQLRDLNAQKSANKQLINMNAAGAISGYINIKNSTRVTFDDNVLEYTYLGVEASRNAISLTIPFQNFMLGNGPMYWEMLEFSINGEDVVVENGDQLILNKLQDIYETIGQAVGEVSQFDPSAEITNSFNDASQAFQNDVDNFSGFINQYNMRTTSERVMFPALLTLSTAGGDLTIILGVCIAACSAGSLIFALRRLHG